MYEDQLFKWAHTKRQITNAKKEKKEIGKFMDTIRELDTLADVQSKMNSSIFSGDQRNRAQSASIGMRKK